MEEGYYYLNNFDNILNSFGECRKRRRAMAPTGPRCQGVELAEASPFPGRLPQSLEACLAPMEPLLCPAWGCSPGQTPGLTRSPGFTASPVPFSASGSSRASRLAGRGTA